tara:strand:+ start:197 stop:310 length:114 start_codon:yes stop_codon:yes gene_type:complete
MLILNPLPFPTPVLSGKPVPGYASRLCVEKQSTVGSS